MSSSFWSSHGLQCTKVQICVPSPLEPLRDPLLCETALARLFPPRLRRCVHVQLSGGSPPLRSPSGPLKSEGARWMKSWILNTPPPVGQQLTKASSPPRRMRTPTQTALQLRSASHPNPTRTLPNMWTALSKQSMISHLAT